ncbi:MAG: oxidase, partial [Verrucomicrobiaceae bacterium]
LATYPGKRPMILLTSRPPQLETPFEVFREGAITPNDAFFVRYHLSNLPLQIDPSTYRLSVGGTVRSPLSLSLDELRSSSFEQVETVAVAQCSGNSRGFFQPRVGGGQLGNGAMGNARWKGVRLKEILEKAGLDPASKQVSFDGMDGPVMPGTPDFVKALDVEQILAGEVLVAHSMNGEDLPMLNGYPLRLVVPGYYATYWVKHLQTITVLDRPFDGFWMQTAYRIPDTPNACIPPGSAPGKTVPISRMNVRSFITSHSPNQTVAIGKPVTIRGIAFDGGEGIASVEFSSDGGASWRTARLGEDLGKFSFREWSLEITPTAKGSASWKVRAFNRTGQSQPMDPLWNPAGYMRNVVETVPVEIA